MFRVRPLPMLAAALLAVALAPAGSAWAQAGPGSGGGPGPGGGNGPGQGSVGQGSVGQGAPGGGQPGTGAPGGDGPAPTRPGGSESSVSPLPRSEQDAALAAVRAELALPLERIVEAARHVTDGRLVDAGLETFQDALHYRLRILETNGDVHEYLFRADTAVLTQVR